MQKQIHKHPQPRTRHYSIYRGYPKWSNHMSHVGGGSYRFGTKLFCTKCREAHKRYYLENEPTCPVCGSRVVGIAQRARLPRKTASKKVWDAFIKMFVKGCNK